MFILRILMLIPFLGVLIAAYAVMALMQGGDMATWLGGTAMTVTQWPSAAEHNLTLTNGDMFVLIGVLTLAIEMVKSTNTRGFSLGNHGLSMLVFIIALGLMLVVDGYATATFLMLTMLTLVDVLVGMMVTIVTARRDIGLGGFAAN